MLEDLIILSTVVKDLTDKLITRKKKSLNQYDKGKTTPFRKVRKAKPFLSATLFSILQSKANQRKKRIT